MDRLILGDVKQGQQLILNTGEGEQNFRYLFTVKKAGELPVGSLVQINPDGELTPPAEAELLGCGR